MNKLAIVLRIILVSLALSQIANAIDPPAPTGGIPAPSFSFCQNQAVHG